MKNNKATKCGNITGTIVATESSIKLGTIDLTLDSDTAYALCNVLDKDLIGKHPYLDKGQREPLIKLGEAIAVYCGHSNENLESA
jgi:hypothetical protein